MPEDWQGVIGCWRCGRLVEVDVGCVTREVGLGVGGLDV